MIEKVDSIFIFFFLVSNVCVLIMWWRLLLTVVSVHSVHDVRDCCAYFRLPCQNIHIHFYKMRNKSKNVFFISLFLFPFLVIFLSQHFSLRHMNHSLTFTNSSSASTAETQNKIEILIACCTHHLSIRFRTPWFDHNF